MKLAAFFLSLWLAVAPAYAVDYVAGTPAALVRGQVAGTATNDNASAGNVGEYQSNSCATQTATVTFTGTTTNLVVWATSPTITALCPVYFTTTGSLPSGISASTTYYVTNNASLTSASFQISTTIALAQAGTAITLSTNGTATTTGIESAFLVTNTVTALVALNLTAGDWDVECVNANTAGSSTIDSLYVVGISTSVAFGAFGTYYQVGYSTGITGNVGAIYQSPIVRESLSSTTLIYCVGEDGFITSTMLGNPFIRARRVR